ncbi:DoxX family protein [Streptosporangiaceae bacterium NEAU-GS5]|nr:DoxX family protein [Streptosporangiaceae bacterium NEAU-GS5]
MKRVLFDLATLVTRVTVGVIFIAHGWQKYQHGIDVTTRLMAKAGVPFPRLSGLFATWVELIGGIMLVAGLLVPVAGVLLALDMLGAIVFVTGKHGLFATENGWELPAALGVASLLLAATGGGQYALDRVVARRSSQEMADAQIR